MDIQFGPYEICLLSVCCFLELSDASCYGHPSVTWPCWHAIYLNSDTNHTVFHWLPLFVDLFTES